MVPVSCVNLRQIAGDRRPNPKSKLAQVLEQIEFTYSAYLAAAGHLQPAQRAWAPFLGRA